MCTDERVSSHLLSSMRLALRLAACRPRLDGTGQSEPPDQLPKVVEATGASFSSSNVRQPIVAPIGLFRR